MPYFVLIAGTLGIVAVWLSYRAARAKVRVAKVEKPLTTSAFSGDLEWKLVASLLYTIVILWAMWSWGISAIKENNAQDVAEELWLSTYVIEHKREWNADCQEILFSAGAHGILYNPRSGVWYNLASCKSLWSAPVQPTERDIYENNEPSSVPPFASLAFFDQGASALCIDQELQECYGWDVFRNSLANYNLRP